MKTSPEPPFAERVQAAMASRGLTLRGFCREARLDPSFVSKVLAGKRSPPSDESVLRRIAQALGLDPAELIVSAGLIPSEWGALWRDRDLFAGVHSMATRGAAPRAPRASQAPAPRPQPPRSSAPASPAPRRELSEELL